jgi:hypothetical protein
MVNSPGLANSGGESGMSRHWNCRTGLLAAASSRRFPSGPRWRGQPYRQQRGPRTASVELAALEQSAAPGRTGGADGGAPADRWRVGRGLGSLDSRCATTRVGVVRRLLELGQQGRERRGGLGFAEVPSGNSLRSSSPPVRMWPSPTTQLSGGGGSSDGAWADQAQTRVVSHADRAGACSRRRSGAVARPAGRRAGVYVVIGGSARVVAVED